MALITSDYCSCSLPLIAAYIERHIATDDRSDTVVVSPDAGGAKRAQVRRRRRHA